MERANKIVDRINAINNILVPIFAIILGLLVGLLFMLAMGADPFKAYMGLIEGAGLTGNLYNIGETVREMTGLIFAGLAVAFAFRTGLFNIGVEGQFIVGQFAAAFVGITLDLPWFLHVPLAILAAMLAGGIWGGIPGWLKARFGVHEVVTTIMFNYMALNFTNMIIRLYLKTGAEERTDYIRESAHLDSAFLSSLFDDARINWGFVVGLLVAMLVSFIMWKTTMGYELRSVGFNPHGSEYAGMNVAKNITLSMFISGAIAGAGGATLSLGVYHFMPISSHFLGIGFDGIAVSLIGANAPLGVILAAGLFAILKFGAGNMQFVADIPPEMIDVVIASIIFFVAASGIVTFIFIRPIQKLLSRGSSNEGGKS